MIIVWSRYGILVPLIAVICFFGAAALMGALHMEPGLARVVGALLGGGVAALAVYFIAHKLESVAPRTFIDEATQRRIVVKPTAGHFMFLPMRYWPYAIAALSLLFAAEPILSTVFKTR